LAKSVEQQGLKVFSPSNFEVEVLRELRRSEKGVVEATTVTTATALA
jgi:hypothetical protein